MTYETWLRRATKHFVHRLNVDQFSGRLLARYSHDRHCDCCGDRPEKAVDQDIKTFHLTPRRANS